MSAGITTFGAVLGLAFGADPDTTETCGLESRSDQRQVAALGGAVHARNRRLDAAHVFDAIFHMGLAIKTALRVARLKMQAVGRFRYRTRRS